MAVTGFEGAFRGAGGERRRNGLKERELPGKGEQTTKSPKERARLADYFKISGPSEGRYAGEQRRQ
jgi:hypothetical protein